MIDGGHEHQKPAGDGNIGGQAGALGADGGAGNLYQNVLALGEQGVDGDLLFGDGGSSPSGLVSG